MKVFLSYSYQQASKEFSASLRVLLTAMDIEVLEGDLPTGEPLSELIESKLKACSALVAVLWPKDDSGDISSSVLEEVTFAHANKKHLFILKHCKIYKMPFLLNDLVYLEFNPENPPEAFHQTARLIEDVRKWMRKQGVITKQPVAGRVSKEDLKVEGWPTEIIDLYDDAMKMVADDNIPATRFRFERMLEIDPQCWRGVNGLAMCDIYEHKYDSAIQLLEHGIEDWPNTPKALGYFWHNRGWAKFRPKAYTNSPESLKEIARCFQVALNNDPMRNISRLNLILVFLALDDLPQAEKEFSIARNLPFFVEEFSKYVEKLGHDEQTLVRKSDWISDIVDRLGNHNISGGAF